MINYEGSVCVHDAVNYWSNAWCWHYDPMTAEVKAYTLVIEHEDANSEDLLDDWSHCYAWPIEYSPDRRPKRICGSDLFNTPYWKIQRFPIEYVPLNGDYVVRLNLSPVGSRMFKGYNENHIRVLPILNMEVTQKLSDMFSADDPAYYQERTGRDDYPTRVLGMLKGSDYPDMIDVPRGIAKVLEIGMPPVMRNLFSIDEARSNSRNAVREFMTLSDDKVLVPSFNVAIIRHRSHDDKAFVIKSGYPFGFLDVVDDKVVFTPYATSDAKDPLLKSVLNDSITTLASQILTEHINMGGKA